MTGNDLQEAASFIRDHERFTILVHVRPDGDAIGAALSCAWMLRQCGKSFRLVHETAIPDKYQFLPLANQFELLKPDTPHAENVIAVDCGDWRQLGKGSSIITDQTNVLNIDHHRTNPRFGHVNYINTSAAATCQLMYHLAKELNISIDTNIATCIYTGLVFDTGGFRYSNTTEEVLQIAAEMIRCGVAPYDISDRILETLTWPQVQLIQQCLQTLQRDCEGKLAWIVTTRDVLVSTGAREEDCEGLVDYARNVEEVEVGVSFRETIDGKIKVSLRSKYYVDVSEIAASFQGGGHARAAGCTLEGSLEFVMSRVLDAIRNQLSVKD